MTQLSASLFQSMYPSHHDASLSENSGASTPQAGGPPPPPGQATPQRPTQQPPHFQQPYPPSESLLPHGLKAAEEARPPIHGQA